MPLYTYINLFTDFGFKRVFGQEPNKNLLISFLNTILPDHHQIKDLEYTQNEHQGGNAEERKAIFDVACTSSTGERFVVELQRTKQIFFKDRSIYYATFPIQEQTIKGKWNFELTAVYSISILDFVFDEPKLKNDVVHCVQLKDQDNDVFYPKLTFYYLTMPNFTKTLDQLETLQDKWFYTFRHLHEMQDIPKNFGEHIFTDLFKTANFATMTTDERYHYEGSLKLLRDQTNVLDFAVKQALEEGLALGLEEGERRGMLLGEQKGMALLQKAALKMHGRGVGVADIAADLEVGVAVVQAWLA